MGDVEQCDKCGMDGLEFMDQVACKVCIFCGAIDETTSAFAQFKGFNDEKGHFIPTGSRTILEMAGLRGKPSSDEENESRWRKIKQLTQTVVTGVFKLRKVVVDSVITKLRQFVDNTAPEGAYVVVLIAACFFATCRIDKDLNHFRLQEIADAFNCRLYEVGSVFTKLKQKLGLSIPPQNPQNFVERMLAFIEVPDRKVKEQIRLKTLKLLDTIYKDHIHAGRPESFCAAALSVVLQALNVRRDEEKLSRKFRISLKNVARKAKMIFKHLVDMTIALPLGITEENVQDNLYYIILELDMIRYVHEATQNVRAMLSTRVSRKRQHESKQQAQQQSQTQTRAPQNTLYEQPPSLSASSTSTTTLHSVNSVTPVLPPVSLIHTRGDFGVTDRAVVGVDPVVEGGVLDVNTGEDDQDGEDVGELSDADIYIRNEEEQKVAEQEFLLRMAAEEANPSRKRKVNGQSKEVWPKKKTPLRFRA